MRIATLIVVGALACGPVGCRVLHAPKAVTMDQKMLEQLDASRPVAVEPQAIGQPAAPSSAASPAAPAQAAAPGGEGGEVLCAHCAAALRTGAAPAASPTPASAPAPAPAPVAASAEASKPAAAPRGTTPAPSPRTHTVQKGETLQKISQQYYGTTRRWMQIYEANRTTLSHPDRITVGMKLVIP
ncbi:MAG: hypothetical protein KatS3mg102_1801 [Planctomycetota bacterium]|nr:MAG: hypothetical protein KatS3mg102_1801 [Planctomycetota bacterium]